MKANRWHRVELAFLAYGYEEANLPLVRRAMEGIGVSHFERTSGAIRAVRTDGGRRLLINPGYTVGFTSEQEILDVVGDVDRWPNGSKEWGITHPINWMR